MTSQRRTPPPPRGAQQRIDRKRRERRQHKPNPVASIPSPPGGCRRWLMGGGAVAVLLLLVGSLLVLNWTTQRIENITQNDPRAVPTPAVVVGDAELATDSEAAPDTADEPDARRLNPFNILLLGVDSRPDTADDTPRSDTLIVVHVDPVEQWVSMLSIPRDSMTEIPGYGTLKINTAYPLGYNDATELYGRNTTPTEGGGALAAEAVEDFLGIRIHYLAQVDFHGFERIVDTFGGLTIDIPKPLLDPEYPTENFGFERIYIPAGLQVLNGDTALRYARSRHNSSDFDRSCRQQRVLRAMLREVRARTVVEQVSLLPEVVADIEESVSTTLPIDDVGVVYALADLARSLSSDRVLQFSINPSNVQIVAEQGSDIYWNEADIQLLVQRWEAGPDGTLDRPVTLQVQNGAGVIGVASDVTINLAAEGYTLVQPSDAPRLYRQTLVIDYTGNPTVRQQLAADLGIDADQIVVASSNTNTAPPAPANADLVLIIGQDYQEEWATVDPDVAATAPPPLPASDTLPEDAPALPPDCSPDF